MSAAFQKIRPRSPQEIGFGSPFAIWNRQKHMPTTETWLLIPFDASSAMHSSPGTRCRQAQRRTLVRTVHLVLFRFCRRNASTSALPSIRRTSRVGCPRAHAPFDHKSKSGKSHSTPTTDTLLQRVADQEPGFFSEIFRFSYSACEYIENHPTVSTAIAKSQVA